MSTVSYPNIKEPYLKFNSQNPENSIMNGNVTDTSAASDSIFAHGDFDRSFQPQPIAFSTPKRTFPGCSATAADTLDTLNNSDLQSTLQSLLEETESLKKEVAAKDILINQIQTQVKSLLDKEFNGSFPSAAFYTPVEQSHISKSFFQDEIQRSFEASRRQRQSRSLDKSTFNFDPRDESSLDLCLPEDSDNLEASINTANVPPRRMIPETTLVLIREMTNFINFGDVTLTRERMHEALHVTSQVGLGLTAGWGSAFFLKNFGKAALTAAGGGGLIIAYAQHKGYIHINWSEICVQLDQINSNSSSNDSNLSSSSSSWTAEYLRTGREWVSNHSVTAGSFLVSFLYNFI